MTSPHQEQPDDDTGPSTWHQQPSNNGEKQQQQQITQLPPPQPQPPPSLQQQQQQQPQPHPYFPSPLPTTITTNRNQANSEGLAWVYANQDRIRDTIAFMKEGPTPAEKLDRLNVITSQLKCMPFPPATPSSPTTPAILVVGHCPKMYNDLLVDLGNPITRSGASLTAIICGLKVQLNNDNITTLFANAIPRPNAGDEDHPALKVDGSSINAIVASQLWLQLQISYYKDICNYSVKAVVAVWPEAKKVLLGGFDPFSLEECGLGTAAPSQYTPDDTPLPVFPAFHPVGMTVPCIGFCHVNMEAVLSTSNAFYTAEAGGIACSPGKTEAIVNSVAANLCFSSLLTAIAQALEVAIHPAKLDHYRAAKDALDMLITLSNEARDWRNSLTPKAIMQHLDGRSFSSFGSMATRMMKPYLHNKDEGGVNFPLLVSQSTGCDPLQNQAMAAMRNFDVDEVAVQDDKQHMVQSCVETIISTFGPKHSFISMGGEPLEPPPLEMEFSTDCPPLLGPRVVVLCCENGGCSIGKIAEGCKILMPGELAEKLSEDGYLVGRGDSGPYLTVSRCDIFKCPMVEVVVDTDSKGARGSDGRSANQAFRPGGVVSTSVRILCYDGRNRSNQPFHSTYWYKVTELPQVSTALKDVGRRVPYPAMFSPQVDANVLAWFRKVLGGFGEQFGLLLPIEEDDKLHLGRLLVFLVALWLGDGTSSSPPTITCTDKDKVVLQLCFSEMTALWKTREGWEWHMVDKPGTQKPVPGKEFETVSICTILLQHKSTKKFKNPLLSLFEKLGLCSEEGHKTVPPGTCVRLSMLPLCHQCHFVAGLIATDGSKGQGLVALEQRADKMVTFSQGTVMMRRNCLNFTFYEHVNITHAFQMCSHSIGLGALPVFGYNGNRLGRTDVCLSGLMLPTLNQTLEQRVPHKALKLPHPQQVPVPTYAVSMAQAPTNHPYGIQVWVKCTNGGEKPLPYCIEKGGLLLKLTDDVHGHAPKPSYYAAAKNHFNDYQEGANDGARIRSRPVVGADRPDRPPVEEGLVQPPLPLIIAPQYNALFSKISALSEKIKPSDMITMAKSLANINLMHMHESKWTPFPPLSVLKERTPKVIDYLSKLKGVGPATAVAAAAQLHCPANSHSLVLSEWIDDNVGDFLGKKANHKVIQHEKNRKVQQAILEARSEFSDQCGRPLSPLWGHLMDTSEMGKESRATLLKLLNDSAAAAKLGLVGENAQNDAHKVVTMRHFNNSTTSYSTLKTTLSKRVAADQEQQGQTQPSAAKKHKKE